MAADNQNGNPWQAPSNEVFPANQPISQTPRQQPSQVPHDVWYVLGSIVDDLSDCSPADLVEPGPARDEKIRQLGKMVPWCVLIGTVLVLIATIFGYMSYASSH